MTGLSLIDKATAGAALLGAAAGVAGSFAVLQRRSLMGDMLAHASLPGVCLAFVLTGSRNLAWLSLGALGSGLAAIAMVAAATRWTRTKEDAAIGIVLSGFFGTGVVLLSAITRSPQGGSSTGLNSFLFGEPGNMVDSDLLLLAGVATIVLVTVALLFKEFQVTAFDGDFARAQGWPAAGLDLAMMALVAGVTIAGLPVVGVILMAAMIILPAATARLWTRRLPTLLLMSGLIGAATAAVGVRLAHFVPAGPAVVLSGAAAFVASLLAAPEHGLLSVIWQEERLRRRIGRDHLLRDLYELSEQALPQRPAIELRRLLDRRGWLSATLARQIRRTADEGLVAISNGAVRLTASGLIQAAAATKAHRLWELYMMEFAGSSADHVDRSADAVEHTLPADLVAELERRLAAPTSVGGPTMVPPSPHPLDAGDAAEKEQSGPR